MSTRRIGVVLLLTLLLSQAGVSTVGLAGVAGAAEVTEGGTPAEQERLPSFDDAGSGSDIAKEYRPDRYVEPGWFQWLVFPLLILGIVATGAVLFAYLVWQPRFADEAKTKRRR